MAALTEYEKFLEAVFEYLSISSAVNQMTAEGKKDPFAFFVKLEKYHLAKRHKDYALDAVRKAKESLQKVPIIDVVRANLRNWLDKQQKGVGEEAVEISELQRNELGL